MTKEDINKLKEIVKANLNENIDRKIMRKWDKGKDNLSLECLAGNSALVIGSEAILDKKKYSYKGGDSEAHMLQCLKSNQDTSGRYMNVSSFDEVTDRFQLMKDLDQLIDDKAETWGRDVMEMIDPSLRLLLESKLFRLVITTAFDPILEYALQKIWGEELNVVNIHTPAAKHDRTKADILSSGNEFNEINPTLFYAFGKIESESSIFAITDDIKIYTIDCWLNIRKPRALLQYIQNKHIIAIGCDFEKWVIKFLWYILSHQSDIPTTSITNNIIDLNTEGKVAVNLSLKYDEEKKSIADFLERKKFTFFVDSRDFTGRLGLELLDRLSDTPPMEGYFFISYAHEDFDIANKVHTSLTKGKQSVWFDKRKLLFGDDFNDEIKRGIKRCYYFIPILSNTIINDLRNGSIRDRYYLKEWQQAEEEFNRRKSSAKEPFIVFPIVTGGYLKDINEAMREYGESGESMPIPKCISIEDFQYFSIEENILFKDLIEQINSKIDKVKRETGNQNLERTKLQKLGK